MATFLTKPVPKKRIINILNPTFKKWFFTKFKDFTLPQEYSIYTIHSRENVLVSAPTGSGKTLSAFGAILNELIDLEEKKLLEDKIYCVYLSPLKALSNDIQKNLLEPLEEMKNKGVRVGLRTGDTTQYERAKLAKSPPHILITTPESLAIMLSSPKFRENFRSVQWCIVDEIHSLAENKRGVHLSLSLERLQYLAPGLTRVGLSATVAPLESIAEFLVGTRECKIVDVQFIKEYDFQVISPVKDLINISQENLHQKMYELIDDLIQKHRTTLIFTNTRAATERVVHHLKDKFPKNYTLEGDDATSLIGAHHGSLSKEHRFKLENNLKAGKLKAVVCLEGNTKILNSNGEWIEIKNLKKQKVQSLNNLKLSNETILNKFKTRNQQQLLKIESNLGRKIACTKNHKFLTIQNSELCWKEAIKFKKGDFIALIRKNKFKELKNEELIKYTYKNYPETGFAEINSLFRIQLKNSIIKKFGSIKDLWEKQFKEDLSYSQLRSALNGEYKFKLKILNRLTEQIKIKQTDIFKQITRISSDKSSFPKIRINEEFMRLLGFSLAEGYINHRDLYASNKNKEVLEYYFKLIKKIFERSPWKKINQNGTTTLGLTSSFLVNFLENLGFIKGRKSRISKLPSFIFRLKKECVFEFLSGYLDGDGYLEVKNNRVYSTGFCTTSKVLAEDISKLLLRENIISSIRSRYCDEFTQVNGRTIHKKGWFYTVVVIGGESLRTFAKHIHPARNKLKHLKEVLELNGYTNIDVIPNIKKELKSLRLKTTLSTYKLQKEGLNPAKYELGTRNISRKQLNKLLTKYKTKESLLNSLKDSDIFWDKIKKINIIKPSKYVYNIEVNNTHNYIANGFITKNCSTSLELGIDIGYVDLVICLGSPKSVSRVLQRAGRSGHSLNKKTKARLIVLDRDDLIECSVMLKSALEKKIDRIHIPTNALDVLAQHIVGMAVEQDWDENELFNVIKKSYCYKDLSRKDFDEILSYLAGEYVSLESRYIYAKIWRNNKKLGKKGRMTRVIYMTNIGTIPDETAIKVKIGDSFIGTIDEGFLERLKPGDIFVLGGDIYQFKFARGTTIQVKGSISRPPTVPSWFSEQLPLSFDLATDINRFRGLMQEKLESCSKKDILDFIHDYLYVDSKAAEAIYKYMKEQFDFCNTLPSNKKILIEHYDKDDEKKIIFHTLFGRRVNDCLSRAIAFSISLTQKRDVEVGISDNGFYISFNKPINVTAVLEQLNTENIEKVMKHAIEKSEVYRRRFRHCAMRSLMILRNYMGRSKQVGKQQMASTILMKALRELNPDFSILKEARREVLEDLMDIENTKAVLKRIEDKQLKIEEIHTKIPSPFAFNLVLQGHLDILKMEDKIEFLKRMHSMVLAKISLSRNKPNVAKRLFNDSEQVIRDKSNLTDQAIESFRSYQKKLDPVQQRLIDKTRTLRRIPISSRKELIKILTEKLPIKKVSSYFIDGFQQYKKEIMRDWPKELVDFLISYINKREKFDFDKYFKSIADSPDTQKSLKKEALITNIQLTARRQKWEDELKYELIDAISKKQVSKETKKFVKQFIKETMPKYVSDDLFFFLKEL
ncbi:DEAD/DEAH box helicase [Candidatus Woesearchaeota archaeon]|jgi:ATP-dependent helicase Lhr and Lhr-like helicase|nr:DEAD/DEAH box helicase [Candidatus Woesearchaeota archaeon]MBT4368172.1 DEAD/DEAH box helicase [Candidatus Woesearchaeota archaeon]MBT4712660.1 DEAD/DEAH box helicase [Candidatus Woesearchaeota archaeon]MBT6639573.1 DEAD/DEAH box helicase [Candidatus Woesearchaeota archaeon]MBT7133745.1 DEAD/DEAH box helicase [Candidatus Woesearchaeota archaeon]